MAKRHHVCWFFRCPPSPPTVNPTLNFSSGTTAFILLNRNTLDFSLLNPSCNSAGLTSSALCLNSPLPVTPPIIHRPTHMHPTNNRKRRTEPRGWINANGSPERKILLESNSLRSATASIMPEGMARFLSSGVLLLYHDASSGNGMEQPAQRRKQAK